MQRLLVENEWYDALPPGGLEDEEYQELLHRRAERLFPEFYLVPLGVRFSSDYGQARPQLALIDRAYGSWWVVLLQTGTPPTAKYLRQQATILREARYGADVARTLAEGNNRIQATQLGKLLRETPGLFVVVGHPPAQPAPEDDVLVGIAEVFRSENRKYVLRINGEQPTPTRDDSSSLDVKTIGRCTRNVLVTPNLLTLVLSDPTHPLPAHCTIEFEGVVSEWSLSRDGAETSLCTARPGALPSGSENFRLTTGRGDRFRLVVDATEVER